MQIGTEKAVLFWRTSVTCHLCAPINRMIFESKECIVKSAYCVREYTLHIPQWKYFSIQCSPPAPSLSPGHSDTHNGVREDSIRLGCVAVSPADSFFLHWLPFLSNAPHLPLSSALVIPTLTTVFVKIQFVWDVWLCRWLMVSSCTGYPGR